MGAGRVTRNFGEGEKASTRFCMHLSGGWFIINPLQIGITANGWTYEPADYSYPYYSIGEFISTTYLHLQCYPLPGSRFYIKAGYGLCSYTSEDDFYGQGNGTAWLVSAGYELPFKKPGKVFWGFEIAYDNGTINNNTYIEDDHRKRSFSAVDFTLFVSVD